MKQSTIVSGGPAAALREGITRRKKGELHHKRVRDGRAQGERGISLNCWLMARESTTAETDFAIRAVESRFSRRLASQMRGSKYFCASKNRSWKRWRGSAGSSFTRMMVNFSLVL